MQEDNAGTPTTNSPANIAGYDEVTAERIRNLAVVGNALSERSSEVDMGTNYLVALSALEKFKEAILSLPLDPITREGIERLVAYLHKKITKRQDSRNWGGTLDNPKAA